MSAETERDAALALLKRLRANYEPSYLADVGPYQVENGTKTNALWAQVDALINPVDRSAAELEAKRREREVPLVGGGSTQLPIERKAEFMEPVWRRLSGGHPFPAHGDKVWISVSPIISSEVQPAVRVNGAFIIDDGAKIFDGSGLITYWRRRLSDTEPKPSAPT